MADRAENPPGNVVSLPDRGATPAEPPEFATMDPLEAGLARIKAADRNFRDKDFLKGARTAFEMVLEAFAAGDVKTLKTLLDGPVYERFAAAIREREKAGHTLESTLVGIEKSEILAAEVQDRHADITVKFVTTQVHATRDASGEIVEGDANAVAPVTDIWTFRRDIRSSNPNWVLVATGSPN